MTEPERKALRALINDRSRTVLGCLPDGLLHGTEMAYRKHRCRCAVCATEHAARRRAYLHRNPAQQRAERKAYKQRRRARASA